MSWIDDAEKRLAALKDRNQKIREHASTIYNALWDELKKNVTEAQKVERFAALTTNGQPRQRVIELPSASDPPKCMQITLDEEGNRIEASGAVTPVTLRIDVCSDGVVCLKIDDREVDYKGAAIAILFPFLYPELGQEPAPPRV